MRGTWQTTDSGGGGKVLLLILGALILLGSGGATALVHTAEDAAWAALAVAVLIVIAVAVLVVHHARNPSPEGLVRLPGVRMPVRYELPDPQRAAIGEAVPRELHMHVHHHYGAEPPREEILRRDQRPEK